MPPGVKLWDNSVVKGRGGGTVVFTDGACSGNPGPGGWGAILWTPDGRVLELGGGEARTTNNRMEVRAALEALRVLAAIPGPVRVFTDSSYMIDGLTKWLPGWRRRGWRTSQGSPVLNRDLWEALEGLVRARGPEGRVGWIHIPGHAGIPGNDRCDRIAVAFSRGREPELYGGSREAYGVDLGDLPEPGAAGKAKKPRKAPKGPGTYLSLLEGKLERHETWAACSARVHGRPAKFKKVCSAREEGETLKAWGIS